MSPKTGTDFRTPAEYIVARQRAHPPKYQTPNGWRALFAGALDFSAPTLRTKAARGILASGEVGELTAVARVTQIGRGYAIEMHSGMMRLIYGAARAITATDQGKFRDSKPSPGLSAQHATAKIAELFKNYREQKIATVQQFPATPDQQGWANTIAIHAETFLLMHELAHIHNEHSFWSAFSKRGEDQRACEVRADSTAGGWLVDYLLHPKQGSSQPQMFYAGAEFGLRVRMAMETIGMQFEQTHPSAGDRVAALRASLHQKAGSRAFYAIANTSLAFDQMWRAIEQMLLNRPPEINYTLDDLLSTMRTLVVELLRGSDVNDLIQIRPTGQPGQMQAVLAPKHQRHIALINSARDYLRPVDPTVRSAAHQHAGDVFEPGTVEFSLILALLNTVQP